MTRIANEQRITDMLPEPQEQHTRFQAVEIADTAFEETYTAHLTKKASKWHVWIPDVPNVKCQAKTKKELLNALATKLHEALVAEEEAWDRQFEADVKAGKFDRLRKEALEDVQAGKFTDL